MTPCVNGLPGRLGLGAKFISHGQAAALGMDEKRFQKKLKRE